MKPAYEAATVSRNEANFAIAKHCRRNPVIDAWILNQGRPRLMRLQLFKVSSSKSNLMSNLLKCEMLERDDAC